MGLPLKYKENGKEKIGVFADRLFSKKLNQNQMEFVKDEMIKFLSELSKSLNFELFSWNNSLSISNANNSIEKTISFMTSNSLNTVQYYDGLSKSLTGNIITRFDD